MKKLLVFAASPLGCVLSTALVMLFVLDTLLFRALFLSPAHAQGYQRELMNPPGWVLTPTPAVDCDFANFAYYNCPLDTTFSLSRASNETVTWADGHLSYAASGQLAISDLGLQVWEGRTNDAIYSNDLTQSGSWTATNIAAAKNATGPDNVANSASTITASAGSATILQSITLSSQADTYSVYVKCVTCTGAIQIAEYPSGTPAFTTLSSSNCFNQANVGTAPNTTSWVRCFGEATVLNPVIGFKITNSGDSVQVFCNQLEPGAFESPCIPTTTISVARAADVITATGVLATLLTGASGSVAVKYNGVQNTNTPRVIGSSIVNFHLDIEGSGGRHQTTYNSSTLLSTTNTATWTATNAGAFVWNSASRQVVLNGGAVASDTNAPNIQSTAYIGSGYGGGSNVIDGNINRIAATPNQWSAGQIQQITTPGVM